MVMYSIHNAETLEKLINTVHHIHNFTLPHGKLFAGQQGTALHLPMYTNAQGIQHYAINSLLYLKSCKRKICFAVTYKVTIFVCIHN